MHRHSSRWFLAAALATLIGAQLCGADETQGRRRWYIGPNLGWTLFDKERTFENGADLRNDLDYGVRTGTRFIGPLWLDLAGGYTSTRDAADRKASWMHGSANLTYWPEPLAYLHPFLSLGGGAARFRTESGREINSGNFEQAVGLDFPLHPWNGAGVSLRLEARNVLWVPKTDVEKAHIDDIVVSGGLMFALGGGGRPQDSDGDGVPDSRDRCPDTPRGCRVDVSGCPIDSDHDGVCDGLDRCPDTPTGVRVDANGCPRDSDGDGVMDGADQCPDTPHGCKVDARGCPIDTDGDGVCDGLDQCSNTPTGCRVDARGCPVDSDGDGVCDGLDQCPDTPAGTRVDAHGCPVETREKQMETELVQTGMIRLHNVNFDFDKATIRPDAYAVLDTVGRVLSRYPQLRIQVAGHTDARGSDAYNFALSNRRAASVRNYLLSHFSALQRIQVTSRGYGESKPLLPNTSEENMAENRRVEFVVMNPEALKGLRVTPRSEPH